jgi:hypothetical protein
MTWPAASMRSTISGCDQVSDDLVRAEAHAVRSLRHAVGRYAEQMRETTAQARRDLADANRKAQRAVEHLRSELHHREHEVKAAQAALAQCLRSPGADCSGLRDQLEAVAHRRAAEQRLLDRASHAAQIVTSAQSDLIKAMQAVDATVGEHSSTATSALAFLDAKLAELPRLDVGHALRSLAVGAVVGTKIAIAATDIGTALGDAGVPFNINLPARDPSITVMAEHETQQNLLYVSEHAAEEAKHGDSGRDAEPTP